MSTEKKKKKTDTRVYEKPRGMAAVSPERRREIASMGGKAAHTKGVGHSWARDREGAARAGARGGSASRGGRGKLPTEPSTAVAPK